MLLQFLFVDKSRQVQIFPKLNTVKKIVIRTDIEGGEEVIKSSLRGRKGKFPAFQVCLKFANLISKEKLNHFTIIKRQGERDFYS